MTKSKQLPTQLTAAQFRAGYVDQVESPLQQRCVTWFRLQYPQLLMYAIGNGGQRSKAEAAIMIGEGVTSGIPDLHLPYPAGEFHSLYIEMKTMKKHSKLSDAQILIHARLRAQGCEVIIPRTFEEFQQQVNHYLANA
jgi:hypothetical protein